MHKLLLTTMSALLLMGCEVIDDAATEKEQPINSEALSVSIPFSQESVFAEVAHSAAIVVTFNNEVILERFKESMLEVIHEQSNLFFN